MTSWNFTESQVDTLRALVKDELKRCQKFRKKGRQTLRGWLSMEIMEYEELLKILGEK